MNLKLLLSMQIRLCADQPVSFMTWNSLRSGILRLWKQAIT